MTLRDARIPNSDSMSDGVGIGEGAVEVDALEDSGLRFTSRRKVRRELEDR